MAGLLMFLLVMLLGFMKLPTTWAAIEADGAPHPDGTSVSSHHSAQKRLIDAELKQRHDHAFRQSLSPTPKLADAIVAEVHRVEIRSTWNVAGTNDNYTSETYAGKSLSPCQAPDNDHGPLESRQEASSGRSSARALVRHARVRCRLPGRHKHAGDGVQRGDRSLDRREAESYDHHFRPFKFHPGQCIRRRIGYIDRRAGIVGTPAAEWKDQESQHCIAYLKDVKTGEVVWDRASKADSLFS